MCIIQGIVPIHWFGDRRAYTNSNCKIITVGLNPSDKEFRERDKQTFSTSLRFSCYKEENQRTLTKALNAYFETNPYKWFDAFEHVLNGMGASYYDKDKYPLRALHTDICSPWATDPTWSKLPKDIKKALYADGHPQWVRLIKKLQPDIIIASVAKSYIVDLGIEDTETEFCRFEYTKDGSKRKRPLIIRQYEYNGIPFINGLTHNTPFGSLSNDFKYTLGETIKNCLL